MIVKINIDIDLHHIRQHGFRTVKSPYLFTQPIIYEAEMYAINKALTLYHINPLNVKEFLYECGMSKPYGWAGLPTASTTGYRIHIVAEALNPIPEKTTFEKIRDMFIMVKTLEEKKSLYKQLIKEYHPDKENGNLKIAQFINSFKSW